VDINAVIGYYGTCFICGVFPKNALLTSAAVLVFDKQYDKRQGDGMKNFFAAFAAGFFATFTADFLAAFVAGFFVVFAAGFFTTFVTVFLATAFFSVFVAAAKLIPPISVIADNTNIDFFNNFIFTISLLQNLLQQRVYH